VAVQFEDVPPSIPEQVQETVEPWSAGKITLNGGAPVEHRLEYIVVELLLNK